MKEPENREIKLLPEEHSSFPLFVSMSWVTVVLLVVGAVAVGLGYFWFRKR